MVLDFPFLYVVVANLSIADKKVLLGLFDSSVKQHNILKIKHNHFFALRIT